MGKSKKYNGITGDEKMALLKLTPSYKDYLWGGHRLVEEYNKNYTGDVLAESWELSCHPDGASTIANGAYMGMSLPKYIETKGKNILGEHCKRFLNFPILIKFIDAKDNLSIQVHPDNTYALKNEGQYGKTEMWYIMDCKPGAYLYYGFKEEITKEEFAKRIEEDTLLEVLNKVYVQKGDVLFIEAGTIHAIGKDIIIAEIQQNSNVTYRVYDYGRVGKDGKKRDLHIEKALAVTNRVPIKKSKSSYPHIAQCDYFTVDRLNLDGKVMKQMTGVVGKESFASILIMEGEGTIQCEDTVLSYKKGDSFFLEANSGTYEIKGRCEALVTTVGERENPVRVGIDIGGTDTKIGLVNEQNELIANSVIPTNAKENWQTVIKSIGQATLALLESKNMTIDQCLFAGVGVPGTVDKKTGTVLYSNNIAWEKIPLKEELEKYLPIPIAVANDADCAALGEMVAGSGKEYQNAVMLTLGTGVGGGVIIDGKLYDGRMIGGSELGHCVIVEDGEPCTCGRKGCFEAYASATALIRNGKKAVEQNKESLLFQLCNGEIDTLNPKMIFEAEKEGDETAKSVLDEYRKKLALGIANYVNIFRPEVILIGGGISGQGEVLLAPVREEVKKQSFGGAYAEVPEIKTASLGNEAGMIGASNLMFIE